MTDTLQDYGLSDTNTPVNRERLLYRLSERHTGSMEQVQEIIKVLSSDPDKARDKKAIMRKSGKESSIDSTSNQGLGSVIDNMPYYVDTCAWWIKGWDVKKYKKSLSRDKKRPRRKPVPRIANRSK